jgi:hypothetical protein
MVYEVFDGTNMIGEFFGKCQGVAYETGDTLPQRIIETLDIIGFPGVLRDDSVLCRRNDPCIDRYSAGGGVHFSSLEVT